MQFMVDSLHRCKIISFTQASNLPNSLCCDINNKDCMYGTCSRCEVKHINLNLNDIEEQQDVITYYKWIRKNEERLDSKKNLIRSSLGSSFASFTNDSEDIIHFQSDGPTTQYRNKTNLFLLTYFANKLGLKEVKWNFSEAGHGKSSADGVGGQLKTKADQFVAHGTDIPDAHTFYTVLKNSEIKVQLFQVSTKDIEAIDEHVMPGLKAITNTMKLKQVVWGSKSPNQLSLRTLSCFACEVKCKHYASKPSVWNFATIPALRPISQKPHQPIAPSANVRRTRSSCQTKSKNKN
ncbi:hypothetical protein JTE90_003164 [Oedothorax gibbosus]|uniref:Uncharacterized protein n=1 Tax=Oedothorax gibbosus TaxID=931172 RepID=A0AAV6U8N3_9ARAC|nr:hypothetical protein JTE90_003164 [Oedothorax gibbosus]